MDNKKMKNVVIGLGAFTIVTLGLGKFFDTRCEGSCIGEAFAANTKDGLDGLGNWNIILGDDEDKIVINKGQGRNFQISTDGESLGGDEHNSARLSKALTEALPGKDLKEIRIKSYITDWKVGVSPDDQIRFVFTGYLPPKEWTVTNTGGKLALEVTKKGPLEAELQLPKAFAGEVIFANVTGDITVDQLAQAREFHLNTVSGDLVVNASATRIMDINTVSGDVTFQPVTLSQDLEFKFNSVSGNLDSTIKTPVKEFSAQSVSGDVEMKAGKSVGFDFEMEGISSSFEGLPKDTRVSRGFANRGAEGSFGTGAKGKLTFNSVSGDFELESLD